MNKKSYTVEEATKLLERYCAYQERCHKEVIAKLKSYNMIPLAIDTIINHLIKNNYLNEERFAKNFARGKFNIKKWGKQRIIRELKLRDITKYNIEIALKEIPEEEYYQVFEELANKRLSQLNEPNLFKKKKKLIDYLLYRGWEPHLVYETVNQLMH
ncbi:regulatory protein RecX [Abyssalbus ytuae]|uniref:Regulatory protein RecX n=1 Tax=Abyssalbus ytuae TaxID=2926907 RepID=A0A9E7D0P2_9FLAO|nr:regulatory protein RecX [Abyssalbus ytuae]UOB16223.1 RecX family transcriptional regulator [Abyssalbus ytuae]